MRALSALASDLSKIVQILGPDVSQAEEGCFGEQGLAVSSTREHALTVVVMSTIALAVVQSFGMRLQTLGIRVLDTPGHGRPTWAATGKLTITVSGDVDVLVYHWETLRVLGSHIIHMSPRTWSNSQSRQQYDYWDAHACFGGSVDSGNEDGC